VDTSSACMRLDDHADGRGILHTLLFVISSVTVVQSQLGEYWQRYITSTGPRPQPFSIMRAFLAGGRNHCNVSFTMAVSSDCFICRNCTSGSCAISTSAREEREHQCWAAELSGFSLPHSGMCLRSICTIQGVVHNVQHHGKPLR
jgi:hypothetical protein